MLAVATELGDVGLQRSRITTSASFISGARTIGRAASAPPSDSGGLTGPLIRERFGQAQLISVTSRAFLAWSLAELGEFAEAAGIAEEAVQIAEAAAHPSSVLIARFGLGLTAVRQGAPGPRHLEPGTGARHLP